jgi:hypothetical protein
MQLTVNDILSSIALLSNEEQSFIVETLNKRICEMKRHQLHIRGQQAQENYQRNAVTSGTVMDLMSAVDND